MQITQARSYHRYQHINFYYLEFSVFIYMQSGNGTIIAHDVFFFDLLIQLFIYSVDIRDKYTDPNKVHWKDETLEGRSHFRTLSEPAMLTIDNVSEMDAGIYRCRVDFRKSPTRNIRLNLTVIGKCTQCIVCFCISFFKVFIIQSYECEMTGGTPIIILLDLNVMEI